MTVVSAEDAKDLLGSYAEDTGDVVEESLRYAAPKMAEELGRMYDAPSPGGPDGAGGDASPGDAPYDDGAVHAVIDEEDTLEGQEAGERYGKVSIADAVVTADADYNVVLTGDDRDAVNLLEVSVERVTDTAEDRQGNGVVTATEEVAETLYTPDEWTEPAEKDVPDGQRVIDGLENVSVDEPGTYRLVVTAYDDDGVYDRDTEFIGVAEAPEQESWVDYGKDMKTMWDLLDGRTGGDEGHWRDNTPERFWDYLGPEGRQLADYQEWAVKDEDEYGQTRVRERLGGAVKKADKYVKKNTGQDGIIPDYKAHLGANISSSILSNLPGFRRFMGGAE